MERKDLTKGQSLRGFSIATLAFLALFASTAVPIPLYADYQATIGLTTADISNTMLTYLSGVTLVLLLAGRASDVLGRVPVTALTLVLGIGGCLLFLGAQSGADILWGRFVQGVAAGFAMSAGSSLVVNCAGDEHLSWGTTVASCGAMFGIMLGSVGAGLLYGAVPDTIVVYGAMIALLALCLVLLALVPEPLAVKASFRSAIRVKPFVPPHYRRLFAVVVGTYLASWLVACFFQSFSAPIAYDCFGETSPLAGALVLAFVMAPSLLGGPLVARFDPGRTLIVGMIAMALSVLAIAAFIALGQEAPFMATCVVFSLCMGVCVATSLRMLLLHVNVVDLSAVLSSVNLLAYAGSAVSGVLSGMVLQATSFPVVFGVQGLCILAMGALVIVYVISTNRTQAKAGAEG